MTVVSVKVPDALVRRIDTLARESGKSRSEVIRDALEAWSGHHGGGSLLDMAGDLVGALEGPGDLSTSPEHLEGYGR